MIRAIQPYYKGYHFRSRKEAQYAVFLDFWNIPYEYEPDGYKRLDDGLCYLPDFRLSPFYLQEIDREAGFYVEIKPTWPPTPQECEKAIMLAIEKEEPVVIIGGELWTGKYKAVVYLKDIERYNYPFLSPQNFEEIDIRLAKEHGAHFISPTKFIYFRSEEMEELARLVDVKRAFTCSYITFCFCPFCNMLVFRRYLGSFQCPKCNNNMMYDSPLYTPPEIEVAYTFARQTRFEHGENPIQYFCSSCPNRKKSVPKAPGVSGVLPFRPRHRPPEQA